MLQVLFYATGDPDSAGNQENPPAPEAAGGQYCNQFQDQGGSGIPQRLAIWRTSLGEICRMSAAYSGV